MPISLCEWRVRIGRFVQWMREYEIIERKEKALRERTRLLKILHERLLKTKGDLEGKEDECQTITNNSSNGETDDQSGSKITNSNPNKPLREKSCPTQFTVKESNTPAESTTKNTNYKINSTFILLYFLLLLLISYLLFSLDDFLNLLENYEPLLKWSLTLFSDWIWLIGIISSVSGCIMFRFVKKSMEESQGTWLEIFHKKTRVESTVKESRNPIISTEKVKNTPISSTTKDNDNSTRSIVRGTKTRTDPTFEVNNGYSKSTKKENIAGKRSIIKENNATTKSTDNGKNTESQSTIPNPPTFKEDNTPNEFTTKMNTSQKKLTIKQNNTLKHKIREGNTAKKYAIIENIMNKNPTAPISTIDENSTPKQYATKKKNTRKKPTIKNNDTPTDGKQNACATNSTTRKNNNKSSVKKNNVTNKSTIKVDSTSKRSTTKDNGTATQSTMKTVNGTRTQSNIKVNNTPTQSAIKDNDSPTQSTIKVNNTPTQSAIIDYSTPTQYTIKDNGSPNQSTIKDDSPTQSTIKVNNTPTRSAIKDYSTPTQYTIKDNGIPTKSTNKDNSNSTHPTIKDKNTPQSAIKDNSTPTQSTIRDNGTPTQSIIKDNGTPTQSVIKDIGTSTQSTIKDNINSIHLPIKDKNTPQSAIKDNSTPTQSIIKDNGTRTQSTIKVNSTSTQSNIKDKGTPAQSTIKDHSTHSKENTLSIATFVTEKAREDCIKKRNASWTKQLLVQAGDVEMNPGPPKRSIGRLQERELLSLAHDVSLEGFYKLCINAMGYSYAQSGNILVKNQNNVPASVFEILCTWKMKQIDGSDSRRGLVDILRREDLNELANQISEGTYYYQESIPTGDGTQFLTSEQVDRCGEDFKTFYRTRLCRIKTDPLDFSRVLEFERIYTNLVLLRNEMGTTRKTPLDYKNLLTTEVNGKLLKRLMVEGDGGAGKTTFCSKIAWDWTNGDDQFKKFDWVLVIPLRDIESNQTIGEIAKTYLSDDNSVQPCQINRYILANPSKVFIIFDGLDEYDGDLVEQGTDIAKIIRSEKYTECMVLVTTRPWKAHQIKLNFTFVTAYAFIAVTGFDKEHISIYINKYFSDDPQAGQDLIRLIESNDVIQENMAPFPIFIAMLCVLWRDSDSEKRELIRRLKTFSQLFKEIITFLKDHYVSKQCTDLNKDESVTQTYKKLGIYFTQIGKIALSGVMDYQLVFGKDDFTECEIAMETCCRVGVLSQENQVVRRRDRHTNLTHPLTSSVFFPHKLFQEYIAGVYLADLFESDHESYKVKIDDLFQSDIEEFRYLLYFTASQSKDVGLDITERLLKETDQYGDYTMLVDVTFEAYDKDAAKVVGHHTFADENSLEISDDMSAHTVSGYLFIMEMKAMETLMLSRRSCGPTVSRDLADIICSSTSLTRLEISRTTFHEDFFGIIEGKIKTSQLKCLSMERMDTPGEVQSRYLAKFVNNLPGLKDLTLRRNNFHECFYTELASGTGYVAETGNSVCRLVIDHRFCNDILQHDLTVEKLFPKLEELFFATLQSVSPSIIGSLAHSSLKKLSLAENGPIDDDGYQHELIGDEEQHPSLVGDRRSLEQEFLNSFPGLTDLAFKDLVIGNNRCGTILLSLKQHQHLKDIRVIHCYTDEEIDHVASAINMEKRMNVELQHAQGQKCLRCYQMSSGLVDALCHRTSVKELILSEETQFDNAWYTSMNGRTVESKIEKLTLERLNLERNDPSSSRDLASFLCLQPCLTDLKISSTDEYGRDSHVWLHDEFYHEIARLASSSKIKKLTLEGLDLESNDPSSSRDLATFLCLQPCLTGLKITFNSVVDEYGRVSPGWLHDEFYHEIARLASSSKIQILTLEGLNLEINDPSASRDLATFLFLQPCLTDLKISSGVDECGDVPAWLHDEFYHEIARLASSSKIQKLTLEGLILESNDPSSSRDLANFLCLQPCLTDLKISSHVDEYGYDLHVWLHDEFYREVDRLASLSKNPFFKNNVTWKTWYNEHRKKFDPQYALQSSQTINSAAGNPTESLESLIQESSSQQCPTHPETSVQSYQFQLQDPQDAQQCQYGGRLSDTDPLSYTPPYVTSIVQGLVNVSLHQKQTPLEVALIDSQPSYQGYAFFPPEVPIQSESLAQPYPLEQSVPQLGTEQKQEHHRSQGAFQSSHKSQELLTCSSSQEFNTTLSMYQGYTQSAPRILQAPLRQSSQSPQLYTHYHIASPHFPSRRQLTPPRGEWLHATQNRADEGLSSFHPPQGWYYSDVFPSLDPTLISQPWSAQAPSQTAAYNQLSQMTALQRSIPDQPPFQQYQLQLSGTQSYQLTPSTSYCPQQSHELEGQSHFSQHAQGTLPPQLINTHQASMIQNQHHTATSARTFQSPETYHYQQHQQRQPRHILQHPVQTPVTPISYTFSQAPGGTQQLYNQVINTHQAGMIPNQHRTATSAGTFPLHAETCHYQQHQQGLPRHVLQHPMQTRALPIPYASSQVSGGPQQPNTPLNPQQTLYHSHPRQQHPY